VEQNKKHNKFLQMVLKEHIKKIEARRDALEKYLNIEQKLVQLEEEELKTQDPDFWNNPKEAEKQMKVIRGIKQWTEAYKRVDVAVEDLLVIFEFQEAGEATN
jgi:peptide chain release factor 2